MNDNNTKNGEIIDPEDEYCLICGDKLPEWNFVWDGEPITRFCERCETQSSLIARRKPRSQKE
jgi:hypothetical protein